MTDQEVRYRIAVKQTAKNLWQIDGTVESNSEVIELPLSAEDLADTKKTKLAEKIWQMITETEEEARKQKRNLVSD